LRDGYVVSIGSRERANRGTKGERWKGKRSREKDKKTKTEKSLGGKRSGETT
jgi:hypothetical protein